MATPVVQGTATSGGNGNSPLPVALPSGITAGDLLVVFVGCNNFTLTTPTGWRLILDDLYSDISSNLHSYAFVKIADGTEGTTLSITDNLPAKWSALSWRISGTDIASTVQIASAAHTTGTSSDPPNITPSGGPKDFLYLAVSQASDTFVPSANAPSGYSTGITATSTGGGSANSKTTSFGGDKGTTATSSENPAAFTFKTGTGVFIGAYTIAIPPVAAQVYTDSATVYLTLTPSGTDVYTPAPAPDSDNLFSQPRVYMEQAIRSHWRARKF